MRRREGGKGVDLKGGKGDGGQRLVGRAVSRWTGRQLERAAAAPGGNSLKILSTNASSLNHKTCSYQLAVWHSANVVYLAQSDEVSPGVNSCSRSCLLVRPENAFI